LRIASVGAPLAELRDQICRRRQIQNVIVGKFLAVELLEKFVELAVERRRLVRVFAVTQRLRQRRGNRQHLRQRILVGGKFLLQMRGNRGVVGGGARKNFRGQLAAQFQGRVASSPEICFATSA
jgi:hypothetical protein